MLDSELGNIVVTSVVRRWQINRNVHLTATAVNGSKERQLELRNVVSKESFSMTSRGAQEILKAIEKAVAWNGRTEG
jgi:hypothetical protein